MHLSWENAFIQQLLTYAYTKIPSILSVTVPSIPDAPEPTTHNDYVDIFNDSIKVITQQMNWDAAKKYCENEGANLASLRNQWTHAYVELLALNLKAPLWIGLNKQQV